MNVKPRKRPRAALILLILFLASAAGIGASYAWNMHVVNRDNIMESRNVKVDIEEEFPDKKIAPNTTKTKKVNFKNTGSAAVFLRVAYNEVWQNGNDWLQDDGSHAVKDWTSTWTGQFTDGKDGWYYYNKVLAAGKSTGEILSAVTFPGGLDKQYVDGSYSLDFIVETVQVSDEEPVNDSATQTVFGRKATVEYMTTKDGAVTGGDVKW